MGRDRSASPSLAPGRVEPVELAARADRGRPVGHGGYLAPRNRAARSTTSMTPRRRVGRQPSAASPELVHNFATTPQTYRTPRLPWNDRGIREDRWRDLYSLA